MKAKQYINIPLCKPHIDDLDLEAVKSVLLSGHLASGPVCKKFEKEFAKYIGAKHAIACNSCTSALHTVIEALGITKEIILPSFSFVASANAIVSAGAVPVFVDINLDDKNIDPNKIEEAITDQTEAVMVVHFGGLSAEMDKIVDICQRHNLALIEDSAEAIGATFNDKKTGSFGVGCFSFFPTKNLTTGEGGMVTTNDDALAKKIRIRIAHGIDKSENNTWVWYRDCIERGAYNFRMSDISAALGLSQLSKLPVLNTFRRYAAECYYRNLCRSKDIIFPTKYVNRLNTFQMYAIRLKRENIRDSVVDRLNGEGIGVSVHFDPPIHKQAAYFSGLSLPNTEKLSKSIVSLPMYPGLDSSDIRTVSRALLRIVEEEINCE